MSAELFGLALRAKMPDQVAKLALLCLVDACQADGTRLYLSTRAIALAAQCDETRAWEIVERFVRVGLVVRVDLIGDECRLDLDIFHRIVSVGWTSVLGAEGDNVAR